MLRIGQGYDVHKLVEGRKLIIGGVDIPHEKGLLGHSDADVLIHAIMDALLGALGLGDIGSHFPDTKEEFKDMDSRVILRRVNDLLKNSGYTLNNMDAVIIAQSPKMAPHIEKMKENLASDLEIDPGLINIKASTTETLGFVGRKEGIQAQAIVLIGR